MLNNYLSVLYKYIIQVLNKNVGLKVGGINMPLPPPPHKKVGAHAPLPPPPPTPSSRFLRQCIYISVFQKKKKESIPAIK